MWSRAKRAVAETMVDFFSLLLQVLSLHTGNMADTTFGWSTFELTTEVVEGEDDQSISEHLKAIDAELKKIRPNFTNIEWRMERTLHTRTPLYKSSSASDFFQQFPFLKHPRLLLHEMRLRFGHDLDSLFGTFIEEAAEKIVGASKGPLKAAILPPDRVISPCMRTNAAVLLLPTLMKENAKYLFCFNEEPLAPTPTIMMCFEDSPLTADMVSIKMDGECIIPPSPDIDATLGLLCIFSLYFLFDIHYPKEALACAPETVFGEEGKSITLAMKGGDVVDILFVSWVFDETDTHIVSYYPRNPKDRQLRVSSSYKSRVEFNTRGLSMELKNLTRNDTGLYTGEMRFSNNTNDSGLYLEDCNISTCTQDGDSTHGGLSIFTRHGSIICNHSNPVSWSQDAVDIGDLCPPQQVAETMVDFVLLLLLQVLSLHTVVCVPETVFGEEGKSITLAMNGSDVVNRSYVDYVAWTFNERDIVTYYPHYPKVRQLRVWSSYKSRVEFNTRDLSMELKNLTKNDTGLYTGEMRTPENVHFVEYYLFVFEPVEKPVLTAHLNWSSGDECQVMVTCRAGDLSVTSSCNISTCTQDGDSTHGGLSIFTRHGSIICNHSNPVSWSQDVVDIGDLCPPVQVGAISKHHQPTGLSCI
ncbi:uncharacterized protein LOC134444011 [Engraulis encrasicolus]|uniref:uncharacterized protein LOC134444011 n=1 Tax=Engraulis encrasicolus TaxID=184585 RepID=UPI002FD240F9